MIIWLNGPFGAGMTVTATELLPLVSWSPERALCLELYRPGGR